MLCFQRIIFLLLCLLLLLQRLPLTFTQLQTTFQITHTCLGNAAVHLIDCCLKLLDLTTLLIFCHTALLQLRGKRSHLCTLLGKLRGCHFLIRLCLLQLRLFCGKICPEIPDLCLKAKDLLFLLLLYLGERFSAFLFFRKLCRLLLQGRLHLLSQIRRFLLAKLCLFFAGLIYLLLLFCFQLLNQPA